MMLMHCELFDSPPKTTKVPKEQIAHPPMLKICIVRNEKDYKKYQGEGSAKYSKVKAGRGKKKDTLGFFFFCLFVFF